MGCGDDCEPDLGPEAGFVDIEPIDYVLGQGGSATPLSSTAARLWYAFHPADDGAHDKPLIVFFNGGPS